MSARLLMIEDDEALASMVTEYLGERGLTLEVHHTGAYFILLLVTFVRSEIETVDDSNSMFASVEKGSK